MDSIHFLLVGFLLSLIINQLNFNVHHKYHTPELLTILDNSHNGNRSKNNIIRPTHNVLCWIVYILVIYTVLFNYFFCITRYGDGNEDGNEDKDEDGNEDEKKQKHNYFFLLEKGSLYLHIYNKKLHIHHWMLFFIVFIFSCITLNYLHISFIKTRQFFVFICGISIQTILDGLLFEDRFEVLIGEYC
jgi:hypothetical protein